MKKIATVLATSVFMLVAAVAVAGNISLFSSSLGDVVFPFTPPTKAGAAGTIDNMTIGATTKRAATFTTVTADTYAGAGNTANFSSPPPIGNTAPNTGNFTTLRTIAPLTVVQGAPAAATVSATLTAANLISGIITVNQGASGASAQQLPLAADMDTALPAAVANDSFDFSVVNISVTSGETSSVTTNTGWTLVGGMAQAITTSARFRARKTGTGAWTLYRLS